MTLKERTQYVQIFPEELDALRVATSTIEPFPPLAFKRLQRLLQRAEDLNFGNPSEPYRPGANMMSYEKRLELARAQHNADKASGPNNVEPDDIPVTDEAEARKRREASAVHYDDDDDMVEENNAEDIVLNPIANSYAIAIKQLAETQAIATHLSVITDKLGENTAEQERTNGILNKIAQKVEAVAEDMGLNR